MDNSNQISSPVIELKNVYKYYDDTAVLKNVSFTVGRGETKIILGGSGSGKSTILKIIVGLEKVDEGEVWVEGENITSYAEAPLMKIRQQIGMVFQEGALFDSLSVGDNVGYRLYEQGILNDDELLKIIKQTLGFVDMEDALEKMPSELSGGMRRRTAIARALVGTPDIMLYDEPTAGLDPIIAGTIVELIIKLRDVEQVSSIFVTHRLNDAYRLARERLIQKDGQLTYEIKSPDNNRINTRFIMLKSGEIIFEGTDDSLKQNRDSYIQKFFS